MNLGPRLLSGLADVVVVTSLVLLVPVVFSLLFDPWSATYAGIHYPPAAVAFLASSVLAILFWLPAKILTRNVPTHLNERDALLLAGTAWLLTAAFASVPFLISGTFARPEDAFFEAMSGLTATGATLLARPESAAPSILLYRALLQFVGGLAIIVLSVALLSRIAHTGARLLGETGRGVARMRPKVGQAARALWKIYAIFAGLLFAILVPVFTFHVGLPWKLAVFEALAHAMATISTGGFTTHATNISFFDSGLLEGILVAFMLLSGMNYTLHHRLWNGDWKRMVRDAEWRIYLAVVAITAAGLTGSLWWAGEGLAEALRHGLFTTVSFLTSTGYVIADTDQWSQAAKLVLVALMFVGASAGSTAGGMKLLRVLLLWRVVQRELRRLLHPRAVIPVRHADRIVPETAVLTVVAFFFAFLTVWMVGALLLILLDPALGLFDGSVAAAAAIGNTGPALGVVGPTESYAALAPASRIIMAALMFVGRLEVFAALVVFHPASWKN